MTKGYVIAIAWPETLCKKAGAWYDGMMQYIGVCKNHYYKVGHAALVLVNGENGNCHYFDFGRYHAPHGHGRVRDEETDHDLKIHTKATFSPSGEIENFEEILNELKQNVSCHGTGALHASYNEIDFNKGFNTAKKMQENSPLPYGPFILKGTNCSRFVRTIILSANPALESLVKISLPWMLTPTPGHNVNALPYKKIIHDSQEVLTFETS
ncbi:MAG: hypothetical protein CVU03_05460 [Bacteroidetes bacterium HGW-Bacteroidetes-2]|jgi:hypothetical protein|nr:MAG: hypothetical protein CVU03_05460 [Bacteroidetes bacterium HGW-Bacteroidetes-2]